MKIKIFHYPKRDKGQKLIVKNDLEYQFAKLNLNENVKLIKRFEEINKKIIKDNDCYLALV
jgi:hypothetical protein